MQFNSRHGRELKVTDGGYVSVAKCPTGGDPCKCKYSTPRQWTLFSDRPIKPGESLDMEVQEGKVCGRDLSLWIGVTSVPPADWNLSVWPWVHKDAWVMDTRDGWIRINGDDAGYCTEWKEKFGTWHRLSPRDRIRLSVTTDRSVSITHTGTDFPRIFTNLPDGDLWVVISQLVKSLRIVPTVHKEESPTAAEENCGFQQLSIAEHTQVIAKPVRPKIKTLPSLMTSPSCVYWEICQTYVQRLGIAGEYFDRQHNMCFCQPCLDSRNDNLYYKRGVPPQKYALPVGWARFGLVVPVRAATLDVFNLWHVAFHGTSARNVQSILDTGDLLFPGEYTMDGKEMKPPTGHFTEKRKPAGFDIKQVFLSPSIRYAGLPAYARPEIWKDKKTKKKYEARVALQLRIKPGSYKIGPETVLPPQHKGCIRIDDQMSNSELEWSTKNRGATITTGLLVCLEPK